MSLSKNNKISTMNTPALRELLEATREVEKYTSQIRSFDKTEEEENDDFALLSNEYQQIDNKYMKALGNQRECACRFTNEMFNETLKEALKEARNEVRNDFTEDFLEDFLEDFMRLFMRFIFMSLLFMIIGCYI